MYSASLVNAMGKMRKTNTKAKTRSRPITRVHAGRKPPVVRGGDRTEHPTSDAPRPTSTDTAWLADTIETALTTMRRLRGRHESPDHAEIWRKAEQLVREEIESANPKTRQRAMRRLVALERTRAAVTTAEYGVVTAALKLASQRRDTGQAANDTIGMAEEMAAALAQVSMSDV
jgi:hypothetical protein